MRQLLLPLILVFAAGAAHAVPGTPGLNIYAAELSVGKFYRMDNKLHKYAANNIWKNFIMPDHYNGSLESVIAEHSDGSISIYFSNLEDLLLTVVKVAADHGLKVASLNIRSHGVPGGLWFPMDRAQLATVECSQWLNSSKLKDIEVYNQYYSPISKGEVIGLRAVAQNPGRHTCIVGAPEWKIIVQRHPELKKVFEAHSEINLLGSTIGLGRAGEVLNGTIASLLLNDRQAVVKSTVNFSLGDWSMPEGMGFWDYLSDPQLSKYSTTYPVLKKDREVAQKGTVRVTTFLKGQPFDKLVPDQTFLQFGQGIGRGPHPDVVQLPGFKERDTDPLPAPAEVRIPGTRLKAFRLNYN